MSSTSGYIRNSNQNFINSFDLRCNWDIMREQLMHQWTLLSEQDLEMAGPDAARIAMLIERKYGIASRMIENYLLNFVRTMPLS